jgi:hypothetical protein
MKESVTTDIEETLIDKKPILILSTARRLWYFTETLNSLVSNIDNIHTQFDGVWLLNDRSSLSDRNTMETMLRAIFADSTDDKLQVFHQKCLFYHIGEDSLINNL